MDLRFSQSKFYEVDLIPYIRPNLAAFPDTEGKGAGRLLLGDSAPRGEWQRAGRGLLTLGALLWSPGGCWVVEVITTPGGVRRYPGHKEYHPGKPKCRYWIWSHLLVLTSRTSVQFYSSVRKSHYERHTCICSVMSTWSQWLWSQRNTHTGAHMHIQYSLLSPA